jgi:hypothetical protein
VVPVTFKLLTQPNRAMDVDIPYAMEKHIPILPLLMEPGIDAFYAEKFGERQYLSPNSTDSTEVSYKEKLKKYLESVLVSGELAQRIRAAFDAYIFLSYRKKDRVHANELMRLIHSYPECRDIAIWFDEFLTPGESFRESIDKILGDCQLFTLLVTPNLLEEPEGKPNFVMAEEYPAARRLEKDILPAQGVLTIRHTAAAQGVGDQADPAGEQPKCHPHRAFVDVLTVTDQFCHHIVPLTGSADGAGLAMVNPGHSVVQMCQVPGTGCKHSLCLVIGAVRVGNRYGTQLTGLFGKCCRTRQLCRHIRNADQSLRAFI